jgi:hypothetical protein
VQQHTQNVDAGTTMDCLSTQETTGDRKRDIPSEQDAGLKEVQSSGDSTSHSDGQQSIVFC